MMTEEQTNLSNRKNPFMVYNGIQLTQVSPTCAVAELTLTENSLNLQGNGHGGVYLTMADCACGAAARASGDGKYVSLSANLNFLGSAKLGETIRAVASPLHVGRTTSVISVDILNGEDRVLSHGTFTMFRMRDWKD